MGVWRRVATCARAEWRRVREFVTDAASRVSRPRWPSTARRARASPRCGAPRLRPPRMRAAGCCAASRPPARPTRPSRDCPTCWRRSCRSWRPASPARSGGARGRPAAPAARRRGAHRPCDRARRARGAALLRRRSGRCCSRSTIPSGWTRPASRRWVRARRITSGPLSLLLAARTRRRRSAHRRRPAAAARLARAGLGARGAADHARAAGRIAGPEPAATGRDPRASPAGGQPVAREPVLGGGDLGQHGVGPIRGPAAGAGGAGRAPRTHPDPGRRRRAGDRGGRRPDHGRRRDRRDG